MMDWDHLRFFLAVARAGNLARAAAALNVNHSTVFRRINALEAELGVRVFDRLPDGYALTAAGEEVFKQAGHAAESIAALERAVLGQDYALSGDIRITTAANLATEFVAPALVTFRSSYPGIRVDVAVSDTDYDLARRQADLALRATSAPPEYLVGRRLMRLPWYVYGSASYLTQRGTPGSTAELGEHDLVGASESFRRLPVFEWLHRSFPREQFVATANELNTVAALVAAGLGLGVLPADQQSDRFVQLFAVEPEFFSHLWLLTHPDLRGVARIRAFSDHLFDWLRADPRLHEL
jgi:DNA-binding transcriptional LysR family regulator